MKNKEGLPTKEELEEFKVKLKQNKKTGDTELYHYPQEPGEHGATEILRYRIARALIGYTTASGRKIKRYGIHLLVGLFIIAIFIYGASRTPYFFDAVATFTFFLLLGMFVFIFIYLKPTYGSIIQMVRKGEEIPIAIQDENGKTKVITTKADETFTNVFTLERESFEYLIPFGVIQEEASNHSPVWWIKWYHYNMLWGAAMYESYDITHLDSWGEVVSWFPADVEEVIKKNEKWMKKEKIPQEEIDYMREKIDEIYKAMALIDENEKELNEKYGRKVIKIKRTKNNTAFFTAWKDIVKDIESYHINRLQSRNAVNKQEESMMKLVNRAKNIEIERTYDQIYQEERYKKAMDIGFLLHAQEFHPADQIAYEQDTTARAPELRQTEDISRRAIDKKIEDLINRGMGDDIEENK